MPSARKCSLGHRWDHRITRSLAQINVEKSCCTRRQSPAGKGAESARRRGGVSQVAGGGGAGCGERPKLASTSVFLGLPWWCRG